MFLLFGQKFPTQSKISDDYVTFTIEENILQLDITVDNLVLKIKKKDVNREKSPFLIGCEKCYLMQVFQSEYDLSNIDAHLVLCELFTLIQVGEEFSSIDVI